MIRYFEHDGRVVLIKGGNEEIKAKFGRMIDGGIIRIDGEDFGVDVDSKTEDITLTVIDAD